MYVPLTRKGKVVGVGVLWRCSWVNNMLLQGQLQADGVSRKLRRYDEALARGAR